MAFERDVKLARKGNDEAFVRLIKQYETVLYRTANSFLHNDNDCADAVQEAILKSYHSLHTLRQPRYFKTWLIRILINECHKILRNRKRVVPLYIEQEPVQHSSAEYRIEVEEALDTLANDQRVIIVLFYFEEFTIQELADVLNVREGTVKSRLYRARSKLAEFLDDDGKARKDGD